MEKRRISVDVGARHLFIAGLAVVPAFLLQDDLPIKAAQALLFLVMARFAGKRVRLLYFLILAVVISLFELSVPWGRLLLRLGPIQVTEGALERGAFKAVTVSGLVFLSLATIRRDLVIPGRLGSVLGESFYYFEKLFDGRKRVERKRFFESLDEILFERFDPAAPELPAAPVGTEASVKTSPAGYLLITLLTAVNWSLLFINLV